MVAVTPLGGSKRGVVVGEGGVQRFSDCQRSAIYFLATQGVAVGEIDTPTHGSLEAERRAILQSVGRDEASFRADVLTGLVFGDEWHALERLDAIT
jgi:hypothetical protein